MSNGIILPAILFLTALASMPDTTLSGRLRARDTGSWLGGEDAYVVAFAESPGSAKDLVVLGYAHPDGTGKWTITGLPSTGNIYVSGFHRGFPAILFYAEVAINGKQAVNLGVQQAGSDAPGSRKSAGSRASAVPLPLADKQNSEIAAELLKLIAAKEKPGSAAVTGAAIDLKPIQGMWTRNGRTYRIEGNQATIEDTGPSTMAAVTAGLVVMRNIAKAGTSLWNAEVLWQLDSERKWSPGTLTLSPDGNTITRESTSPWNNIPEAVVLRRK